MDEKHKRENEENIITVPSLMFLFSQPLVEIK
jgi:hypothetical protein